MNRIPLPIVQGFRHVGDMTPWPAVASVAGVATVILEELARAKGNDLLREALEKQINEAVVAIQGQLTAIGDPNDLPEEVLLQVQSLTDTLSSTYQAIVELQDRRGLSKLFKASTDAEVLKGAREDIRHALHIFLFQANVFMHRRADALASPRDYNPAELPPPPVKKPARAPTLSARLPSRPPLLLGRNSDLEQVLRTILAGPSKHLVILGAPGIGKSTLALTALHHEDVVAAFKRRFYVNCDAHASVASLLAGLGLKENQFLAQLRSTDTRTLLVLDAFEMPQASDLINSEELLAKLCGTPGLTVLATLRGAERPPSVPTMVRHQLEQLDSAASEQLFLALADRAPDLATKRLIQEADGVPLALTLLAHRPEGSAGEVPARESDRLDQVIAVSVNRMNRPAQDALALLARAPDGLERALLAQAGVTSRAAVTALLKAALAVRSPLPDNAGDGERIGVLAPIRAYARKHLAPPAQSLSCLRRHFIEIGLSARLLGSTKTAATVRNLKREAGNLISVLREPLEDGGPEWRDAARASIAVGKFMLWSGGTEYALQEACVDCVRKRGDPRDAGLLASALLALARMLSPQDPRTRELVDEALEAARRSGDVGTQVDALSTRSITDAARDLERLDEAQKLADKLPDDDDNNARRARILLDIGQTHLSSSDYGRAAQYYGRAKAVSLPNAMQLQARALFSYGHIEAYRGRLQSASRAYASALTMLQACDSHAGIAHCITYQGFAHWNQGDYQKALMLYEEAANHYARLDYEMDECLCRVFVIRAATALGIHHDLDLIMPDATPSWAFGCGAVCIAKGELAMADEDYEFAVECFQEAKENYQKRKVPSMQAECDALLGEAAARQGRLGEAERRWVCALLEFRRVSDILGCRNTLRRWGQRVPHIGRTVGDG
ncbi:hypothetical protein AURDEDRAFT_136044 [Auricularia subglabra TFB-10046 SS5]|nr:hypothetical protein AURDEDRAFT_136044 [Auricularia subglabra TFB-10046 SS5]